MLPPQLCTCPGKVVTTLSFVAKILLPTTIHASHTDHFFSIYNLMSEDIEYASLCLFDYKMKKVRISMRIKLGCTRVKLQVLFGKKNGSLQFHSF